MKLIYTSIFCLLFVSCLNFKQNTTVDPSEDISDAWEEFIENWENEDAIKCVQIYSDDITFIPPGRLPINGSNAVADFYMSLFENNQSSVYYHETLSIDYCENMAVEYANFTVDWVGQDGNPWTYQARMINNWVVDENGIWKIEKLIFNTPSDE